MRTARDPRGGGRGDRDAGPRQAAGYEWARCPTIGCGRHCRRCREFWSWSGGATGLVAKIRTDQTIPVALVHQFANDFLAGLNESARERVVFIPGAHWRSLYEIDDLVFVGTLPAMKRFFEAQVGLAPFHSGTASIHGDLVRKHLSWTVGPALGLPAWRAFQHCHPTLRH